MQRSKICWRASSHKNYIVNMLQKSRDKLLKSSCHDRLPLYYTSKPCSSSSSPSSSSSSSSGSRSSEKCVHVIPIIVLFCLFALWWFSFSVDIEIKDGRVTAVRQVDIPRSLDETHIDLTSLASAAVPPYAAIYQMQTMENKNAAEPEGKIC